MEREGEVTRALLVMRHGKSRWDEVGLSDHDRELTKRGKRDARRMGEELAARGWIPDAILSSTAERARDTARRLAKRSGYGGEIALESLLYTDDEGAHLGLLSTLDGDVHTAMIVGHNPVLEDLVALLTGEHVRLTTANIARVELPIDDWYQLITARPRGRLRCVLRPKELVD